MIICVIVVKLHHTGHHSYTTVWLPDVFLIEFRPQWSFGYTHPVGYALVIVGLTLYMGFFNSTTLSNQYIKNELPTACRHRAHFSHRCNNNKTEKQPAGSPHCYSFCSNSSIIWTYFTLEPTNIQKCDLIYTLLLHTVLQITALLFALVSFDRVCVLVLVSRLFLLRDSGKTTSYLFVPPFSPAWRSARQAAVMKSVPGSYLNHDIKSTHLRQQRPDFHSANQSST